MIWKGQAGSVYGHGLWSQNVDGSRGLFLAKNPIQDLSWANRSIAIDP